MMDVFTDYIDKFVLVFLDDILIYSMTEDHLRDIRIFGVEAQSICCTLGR
jgi:hypothetical protein